MEKLHSAVAMLTESVPIRNIYKTINYLFEVYLKFKYGIVPLKPSSLT